MANTPPTAEVLEPDYWGVDINDPSVFTDTLSYPSWTEDAKSASSILGVMRRALASSISEGTNPYGRIFNPTPDQLPNGTVLILHGEALIGSFDARGKPAKVCKPPLGQLGAWARGRTGLHIPGRLRPEAA